MSRLIKCFSIVFSLLFFTMPPANARDIDVYAHRGLSGLLPESTMASYQAAMALDVDVIDMDVHVTNDNVVVVIHDPQLMAALTRNGSGSWLMPPTAAVKGMSLEQLQAFDVGRINPRSYLARSYPDIGAADGSRVPSLEQVIQIAEQTGKKFRYQIELKVTPYLNTNEPSREQLLNAVLKTVKSLNVLDRVELQSFDFEILLMAKKREPSVHLSFVTQESGDLDTVRSATQGNRSWTAGYDVADYNNQTEKMIAELGGSVWNPFYQDLTRDKIANAHQLGLKVVPWTVNRVDDMRNMIEMGVDGLITNRSDILLGVLAARDAVNAKWQPAAHGPIDANTDTTYR